jgi:hypothetical protein
LVCYLFMSVKGKDDKWCVYLMRVLMCVGVTIWKVWKFYITLMSNYYFTCANWNYTFEEQNTGVKWLWLNSKWRSLNVNWIISITGVDAFLWLFILRNLALIAASRGEIIASTSTSHKDMLHSSWDNISILEWLISMYKHAHPSIWWLTRGCITAQLHMLH